MHIHAGGKGVCPPASAARLHNGHLSISTTDGIKFYGPPQVSLTSTGDTSPKSIVDFSRYPTIGNIRYTRTDHDPAGRRRTRSAPATPVIVVHGIDYNHNGIYDNVLDRSELNNSLARRGDRAGAVRPAGRRPRPRPRRPVGSVHDVRGRAAPHDRSRAAAPGNELRAPLPPARASTRRSSATRERRRQRRPDPAPRSPRDDDRRLHPRMERAEVVDRPRLA